MPLKRYDENGGFKSLLWLDFCVQCFFHFLQKGQLVHLVGSSCITVNTVPNLAIIVCSTQSDMEPFFVTRNKDCGQQIKETWMFYIGPLLSNTQFGIFYKILVYSVWQNHRRCSSVNPSEIQHISSFWQLKIELQMKYLFSLYLL